MLSLRLESNGYQVMVANDPREGLRLIQEQPPDIVLLDLYMPFMDGAQVLGEIRKTQKELPVIIISADLENARTISAAALGVSGIFYKGKDFSVGLALLETALRRHKQLRE